MRGIYYDKQIVSELLLSAGDKVLIKQTEEKVSSDKRNGSVG